MNDIYVYLVERKSDGKKFAMITNLKNHACVGSGKYLYDFVPADYIHGVNTPYGIINNVGMDAKYNRKQYRVIHCTKQ